jgi:hypothetical protein
MIDFEQHPALQEVRRRQREFEEASRQSKVALDSDLESLDPGIWEGNEAHRRELKDRVDVAHKAFQEALAQWKPIKKQLEREELAGFARKLKFWKR